MVAILASTVRASGSAFWEQCGGGRGGPVDGSRCAWMLSRRGGMPPSGLHPGRTPPPPHPVLCNECITSSVPVRPCRQATVM
eukprot:352210-Chlamydomonas_euryale.AAC.4